MVANFQIMHSVQPEKSEDTKPAIREVPYVEHIDIRANTSIIKEKSAKTSPKVKYYDVPLSHDVQNIIFSECSAKKVPTDLVVALIAVESNYRSNCISQTHDYGLMQINVCHMDSLSKQLKITNLLDEKQNIKAGVHMLSWIVDKYKDINKVLMVYNCGESGAKKLWKQGVYSTDYTRKVMAKINEIKR
jgi:soluble lytic murein transglycosylase-like protein